MNISARMIIVLTVVCLFSGLSLVFVNQCSKPQIEKNAVDTTQKAVYKVLPNVKNIEKVVSGETVIFKGFDKDGEHIGYAFVAEGNGYQGNIKIMVGISPELEKLIGIEILESVETPGLGAKITEDEFKCQFKGVSVSPEIAYVKGKEPEKPNEIETITGATISSKSVVKILNVSIEKVKEILKGKENRGEAKDE